MKTSSSKRYLWITAVAGVTAILGTASANAAFVNILDNSPGFPSSNPLGGGTTGLTGTVIASREEGWTGIGTLSQGVFQGTLRSMVVDTGAGYDFYYQVLNTSTGGTNVGMDIWRIAIPGYALTDPLNPVDATYRTDGIAGLTLDALSTTWAGTQISNNAGGGQVFSADRDIALDDPAFIGGGAAFDFDASQFLNLNVPGGPTSTPDNIEAGERSNWLVLRTNYTVFNPVDSAQLGGGLTTALANTFAPIPEPSTVLFGLAMIGACAAGRVRKSRIAA